MYNVFHKKKDCCSSSRKKPETRDTCALKKKRLNFLGKQSKPFLCICLCKGEARKGGSIPKAQIAIVSKLMIIFS